MNLIKQIKDVMESRFGNVNVSLNITEHSLDISFNQVQSYNVWGRNLLNYQTLTDKQLIDLITVLPFYDECDEVNFGSYDYDCSVLLDTTIVPISYRK